MTIKGGQAASSRRRLGAVRGPAGAVGLLLGAALVTWIVTIERMSGMDGMRASYRVAFVSARRLRYAT